MKRFVATLMIFPSWLLAQTTTPAPSTSEDKVIVIEQSSGRRLSHPPQVLVESGNEKLSSSPEDSIKSAYRSWESACKAWKNEMRQLNKQNLMVASCGTPHRSVESIQSKKLYTYSSKASYKIKVVGK